MYAILYPTNDLSAKRFDSYFDGIRHIRRFFREENGDECIVVPVPFTGE